MAQPNIEDQDTVPAPAVAPQATAPISLTPDIEQPNTQISLPPQDASPAHPPAPEVAKKRAEKWDYTFGRSGVMDTAEIYNRIYKGDEPGMRDEVASILDQQKSQQKQQMLLDMSKQKGGLDPTDVRSILDPFNPANRPTVPQTVLEENFGKTFIGSIYEAAHYMKNTALDDAVKDIPEQVTPLIDKGNAVVFKMEYLRTWQDTIEDTVHNQGYLPYLIDQAKSLTQIYPEAKMRGLVPEVGYFAGLGLGSQLKAQADYLLRIRDNEEFRARVDPILSKLQSDNPTLAKQFVDYLVGTSSSQRFLDNTFTAIAPFDIASGLKGGLTLARYISLRNRVNTAVKDVVAAAANPGDLPIRAAAAEGAGNLPEAAVIRVAHKQTKGQTDYFNDMVDKFTSNLRLDLEDIRKNPGSLSREQMTRLEDGYGNAIDSIVQTATTAARVDRTPIPSEMENALRAYNESVLRPQFAGLESSILDFSPPLKEPLTNTRHIEVSLGDTDASLFSNPDTAQHFANISNLTGAKVVQEGLGYKLVVVKPYIETSDMVRNYMIETNVKGEFIGKGASSVSTSKNPILAALSKWRGADDTLAYNDSVQRGIATYTQNLWKEWAKSEQSKIEAIATGYYKADPITGTSYGYWSAKPRALLNKVSLRQREVWNRFTETLDTARKLDDPVTQQRGYFFKSPGELEDHYLRYYGESPTFPEVEAYFAHVKLNESHRMFMEMAEFRNRARIGTEQHQINVLDRSGVSGSSQFAKSGFFDGIRHTTMPHGRDNVLIMGSRLGEEKLYNLQSRALNPQMWEQLDKDVASGRLSAIEAYNPDTYPLKDFSDVAGSERIRYIISDNVESKPLDFNHVVRRGGGHFEYDYDHYIKQAMIVPERAGAVATDKRTKYNDLYTGDQTVMPIDNRAKGRDIARRLDAVRELIHREDWDGAQALAERTLPIKWDQLSSWFKPSRDSKGNIQSPRLSTTEPFYVVPRNKKIYDLDKSLETRYPGTFRDGTREGSAAAQNIVAFNMQRDATDIGTITGGRDSALWKWEPAKLVDPIPTMNRALNRAINSTYMDDYKIFAVEHWLREAGPYLREDEFSIRASPFWNYNQARSKDAFKPGAPQEVVTKLLGNKLKIDQFVGIPNTFDTWVHTLSQHIADTAYEKGGLAEKASLIPLWALSHVHDPVRLLRSFAFNAKLGLFNPVQILVQTQNYATIAGIAGFQHAAGGTFGAFIHGWSNINRTEGFLGKLDEMAVKMGYGKTGDWLEANKILRETGFEHVSGEYAMADNVQHKFIGNDWGNFLNAGQAFFRAGEKASRLGAWYTAYREFREIHPTGAISDTQRAEMLKRADLLNSNMTRASNSALNTGVASLPMQFMTYTQRTAELMFGNRISTTAKLRMAAIYSGLYGIPTAFGLTGIPLYDVWRQEALDNGYVMGHNWFTTTMNEGLPATMMAMITGKGDLEKGNFYNVGPRYGIQGFQQLWSDNVWWKLLGGASVSIFANTIASASPLTLSIISGLRADGERHPFKVEDALDIFKEVSSINTGWQVLTALNTGRWLSKNEGYQGDVTALNALFMGATGLHSQRSDDAYQIANIAKTEAEYQKYTEKMVIKEVRRGLIDSANKNQDQANDYHSRAFWRMEWAGMPLDMRAEVISKAMNGYETQADQVQHNFATSKVPTKKWFNQNVPQTRTEQYRTQLQQDYKK